MRRLSILDIAGGHQPMGSADGRFAVVYNGELFNHLALRRELPDYPFVSHCDTETIVAAFAKWGNDAWAKLEGMFAVAVWDRLERTLTLARDPLGIKPLYVSEQNGGLSFASELKALRVVPDHQFTIDERAIDDFFSFGHVRQPRSIFRETAVLPPGHFLTFGPTGKAAPIAIGGRSFALPSRCPSMSGSSAFRRCCWRPPRATSRRTCRSRRFFRVELIRRRSSRRCAVRPMRRSKHSRSGIQGSHR